jgi:thiamine biosynthesis protein ThiI
VGTGGRGLLLLSGGIDSPVAGYRMLRRGLSLDYIYFHASPYTSEEAKQKVVDLARMLADFGLGGTLHVIPFTDVQTRIREKTKADYATTMLRYCMMKAANQVAREAKARVFVTGESLGQVASQTLENMECTEAACAIPLLRPLVGMDKEEIIETARFIGTYDTSILPYADCCVLFAPAHPVLKARVRDVEGMFGCMDAEGLISDAVTGREIVSL